MVKREADISEIRSELDAKITEDRVVEKVMIALSDDCYRSKWARPLLTLVEYHLIDSSNPQYIDLKENIHVEHVLPIANRQIDAWNECFTDVEADSYLNKIENLTLLSGKKNISASYDTYENKRKIYHGKGKDGITSFRITQHIYDTYQSWNPESLNDRRSWLYQAIEEFLSIDLSKCR